VRSIGGVATAFAALAIAAPASHAGSATYAPPLESAIDPESSRTLTYAADSGPNRVSLSTALDGTAVDFSDALAPIPATTCSGVPCEITVGRVLDLVVNLGDGDDGITVGPGVPTTTVNGGDGVDEADFSSSGAVAKINGVEHASGGSAGDALTASPDGSVLYGEGGADTLTGGDGNDRLDSGADNDTILAANGDADVIDCGPGDQDSAVVDLGLEGPIDVFEGCENVDLLLAVSQAPSSPTPAKTPAPPATVLPVQVLAPGIAAPRDVRAPAAYVRSSSRQRLKTVLTRGLLVPVGCGESCGVSVNVLLDRKVARRLDLAGRTGPAVIGTATARLSAAGRRTLRVKLTQDARRALRKSKSVAVTLQVLVSDAAGNATLLQRRVSMRG
jgi:hypothetical protein